MPDFNFNKCCFFVQLKIGCLIFGYLSLIVDTISITLNGIALSVITMTLNQEEGDFKAFLTITIVIEWLSLLLLIMLLVLVIILLVGLHQDKAPYVKAYLIYGTVFAVMILIYDIYKISVIVHFYIWYDISLDIIQLIFSLGGMLLYLAFNIYGLLVIRSQYNRMQMPALGPAIYNTACHPQHG